MLVEKVINNNIVRSINEKDQEVLVMGSGLGFKKKIGDPVDETKVEKTYIIESNGEKHHLEELLARIPIEHIRMCNEIIDYAKLSLSKPFPENIYISLTDHISFALERSAKGIVIQNALLWEIKRFYNHEYEIGIEALEIIERTTGIKLPEDEAGFIALYLAGASLDSEGTDKAKETMSIIQSILKIVKFHYNMDLDEESLHYERFVTHLKFFIQRVFTGNALNVDVDEEDFLLMLKEKYKEEYLCALKIYDYFLTKYDIQLTNDEMMYLTIHIRRITKG